MVADEYTWVLDSLQRWVGLEGKGVRSKSCQRAARGQLLCRLCWVSTTRPVAPVCILEEEHERTGRREVGGKKVRWDRAEK